MHNATYINERMYDRYPFLAGVFVPFPDHLISELRICVREGWQSVYVSTVQIMDNSVRVTVCAQRNGSTYLLGYIRGGNNAGTTQIYESEPFSGFLIPGQISEADNGTYSGRFELDPSCVTVMPDAAYGHLTGVEVNGNRLEGRRKLEFNAIGLFEVTSGSQIVLNSSAADAHFVQWDNEEEYNRVTRVNGMSGKQLNIVITSGGITADVRDVSRTIYYVSSGGLRTTSGGYLGTFVAFCGGSSFPHCYNGNDESEKYHGAVSQS